MISATLASPGQGQSHTLTLGPSPLDKGEGNNDDAMRGPRGIKPARLDRIVELARKYHTAQRAKSARLRDMFFRADSDEGASQTLAIGPDDGADRVQHNFTFPYVTVLMAVMFANSPDIQVEPQENSADAQAYFGPLMQAGLLETATVEEAAADYAAALAEVLEYGYERGRTAIHVGQALQESIVTGMGVLKHSLDAELGIDRTDCLKREELYIDEQARFDLAQARYVVHISSMPLDDAKDFFQTKIDALKAMMKEMPFGGDMSASNLNLFNFDPEFNPQKLTADGQYSETGDAGDKTDSQGEDPEKDCFRFYEIWSRDKGERWVYYRSQNKLVDFRMPWPFALPTGEYPFSALVFNRRGERMIDAFSELSVVSGLKKTYQRLSEFMRKYVERACGKILLYSDDLDDEQVKKAKESGELNFIKCRKGQDPAKLFSVVNLNEGDEVVVQLLEGLKSAIDEILGNDELMRGADSSSVGKITATEARFRQDSSTVRLNARKGAFDAFLKDMFLKRACIARQKIDPAMVAKIAGEAAGLLWQMHYADPDEFNLAYTVDVEAGSTGMQHKQDMLQMLQQLWTQAINCNTTLMQGNAPPKFDPFALTMRIARLLDKNPDQFLIKQDLAQQQQAAPQQPGPQGDPGPGTPAVQPGAGPVAAAA